MSRLLQRPRNAERSSTKGRFERFDLTENPFPTEPVNKDSSDRRINGQIYESEIRSSELRKIRESFLDREQADRNRLRIGYICDTSYIGRGNGKSAFLVNLSHMINENYCLDMAGGANKCFALYLAPEPGGRTKTFPSFVDLVFESLLSSGIIETCLAIMRISAISSVHSDMDLVSKCSDEEIVRNMNTESWLREKGVDLRKMSCWIEEMAEFQSVPRDFPVVADRGRLLKTFLTAESFRDYYLDALRKGKDRIDFLFSHLIYMFQACGFNGAYLLVDDFERIPDFQSKRQRKDFAIELRSCLLDGPSLAAKAGFYTALFVLHAGVPRLISEAWELSGLESRYPIDPRLEAPHWVAFEKLDKNDVSLLLTKYLSSYRISKSGRSKLFPFQQKAVEVIAQLSENNAARILRTCSDLLDKAADDPEQKEIDEAFVVEKAAQQGYVGKEDAPTIEDPNATDLMRKARDG